MWAVRESLMSLKRKEIDSSQETDENSVKSQIRLKKEFTKKTICLAFSRRFSFSSGLVFFFFYGEKIIKMETFLYDKLI